MISSVVQTYWSVAMPSYVHLSSLEREQIAVLHAANRSNADLAKALGRSPATISRELNRNTLASGMYSPRAADGAYLDRGTRGTPCSFAVGDDEGVVDLFEDAVVPPSRKPAIYDVSVRPANRKLAGPWQLKVFGYIDLTRLALDGMRARGGGTIVNVIGDLGRAPRFDYVCGSTANAALIAFTEAVGARSTDWNVRVFGINPSGTRTERVISVARGRATSKFGDPERWQEVLSGLPFDRLAEPAEIASVAVMLTSPLAGYLSGTVVDVDAGLRHRK